MPDRYSSVNYFRSLSMGATLEQYNRDLKLPMKDLGFNESLSFKWGSDHDFPFFLTGWAAGADRSIGRGRNRYDRTQGYHIDHYNPEFFLLLCIPHPQSQVLPIVYVPDNTARLAP